MADKITADEILRRRAAMKEHGSASAAAASLGISRRTLDETLRLYKDQEVVPGKDQLAKAKVEIASLRAQLRGRDKINDSAEKVRAEIHKLQAISYDQPDWVRKAPSGKTRAGIPFAFWSDWHYGEVVSLSETGGANAYNRKIAQDRVRRLTENTIRLAKGFAFRDTDKAPPGMVLALGGDMISGDIHEELAETNVAPPFVCVQEVFGLLTWSIDQLVAEFGRLFIPCVVGNHGRTTKKPRAKNRVFMSYEWNLYTMLERHYAKDPRITFFIPGETDAFFRVAGQRFLLTHGDSLGVKGGDGIIGALGPIARGTVKLRNSEYKIGREFDYLIMGHWHQELWIGRTIVNNALKGYDEYARLYLRAEPSRPSQSLWFIHPEHGMTARVSVYVDKPIRQKAGKWVEIQQGV